MNYISKINKSCLNCNKEFITTNGKREKKFCSLECYFESKKQNFVTKICKTCNKEFEIAESQAHKYSTCSKECSKIYQDKLRNERYKDLRVEYFCEYCGKSYNVAKSLHEHPSRSSRFCSMKCRNKWESENKRGENHHNYGIKYSKAKRRQMSEIVVKLYENGVYDKQTLPQKIVNNLLINNNIKFINEKGFKYYLIDNYLLDYNLAIEVNGDYFHSNPLKYPTLINKMQKNNITRDKRKRTYLKRYGKFEILYLWESDIKQNPELCEKLILEYIKNKGQLRNYQSFNYELINNKLVLKNDLIIPYIDLSAKEVNQLTHKENP